MFGKQRLVLVVAVAVGSVGIGWAIGPLGGAPADRATSANDDESQRSRQEIERRIDELLKKRHALFQERYELLEQFHEAGRVESLAVRLARNDALEAELPLYRTAQERIAVYEKIVENLKPFEGAARRDHQDVPAPRPDSFDLGAPNGKYLHLEAKLLAAQIALERERLAALEASK